MMDIFEKSVHFAMHAHSGHVRKRSHTPYILHPFEAATIAATITDDTEVLAAAVLHDTVEDTAVTIEEIRAEFGDKIAGLVACETEEACEGIPRSESWRYRKEHSLQRLQACGDRDVKIIWLSDKLSNMRSFYRLWQKKGNALWENFHQNDPAQQAWYYHTVALALAELSDTPAYKEYQHLYQIVFSEVNYES